MSLLGVFLVLGVRCWLVLRRGWMVVRRAGRVPIGGFCSGGDLAALLSSRSLAVILLLAKLSPWRFPSIGVAL